MHSLQSALPRHLSASFCSRLKTSKSVNKIKSFAALLKKVQSDSVSDEEQPEGLAEAVTLRPYQNQSLRFMLDRYGSFCLLQL